MATTTFPSGQRIDYAAVLPHRTKLIILAGVLLSLFLAALDQTIVATALPAIVGDFNGLAMVGWISTGYLLASTAMIPIYGKLSDIYGRRAILVWGISVFLIGSILCGIASSMTQLIAYRVIQGIGAAALTSTAFAIPADLFSPADRPRYMGLFGGVFGVASVIGPFVGGLLTDRLSWHWVFFVNLPLGLLALTFVLLKMPQLASGLRAPIDWLGTVLLIVAVVPLLLGLTMNKQVYGWGSPLILSLFAVGLVATALFVWVESRVASPIISLQLFRNRTYWVTIVASMLSGAAFFTVLMFLALFMVNVLGTSATAAGSAQIPLMLAFVTGSVVSSQLVARTGHYKRLVLAGLSTLLIGLLLLTQIGAGSTTWDVAWRIVLVGLGLGPTMPLLALAVQNAVPFEQVGQATASRQFFLQLGQAAGAALFGVLISTSLAAQLALNVGPTIDSLPANLQGAVSVTQLASSGSLGEGSTQGIGVEAQLNEAFGTRGGDQAVAQQAAAAIAQGVRESYATSIVGIYWYAIGLVTIALLVVGFGLPELPLRASNKHEPMVTME